MKNTVYCSTREVPERRSPRVFSEQLLYVPCIAMYCHFTRLVRPRGCWSRTKCRQNHQYRTNPNRLFGNGSTGWSLSNWGLTDWWIEPFPFFPTTFSTSTWPRERAGDRPIDSHLMTEKANDSRLTVTEARVVVTDHSTRIVGASHGCRRWYLLLASLVQVN